MDTAIVQVRGGGNITLPKRFRERYGIEEGDPLTLVDLEGLILLVPKTGVVPKLAAELERLRVEAGLSLDELLSGLPEERQRSLRQRVEAD